MNNPSKVLYLTTKKNTPKLLKLFLDVSNEFVTHFWSLFLPQFALAMFLKREKKISREIIAQMFLITCMLFCLETRLFSPNNYIEKV